MDQTFINKYFYYYFLFTTTFGILLYNIISFKSSDELCALLLLIWFVAFVFSKKNWEFNKLFFLTICVFLFYTGYSFYIHSNSAAGIITDLIIQMKPYLAFFAVYQMRPYFSEKQKDLLKNLSLIVWVIFLPLGIYGIFNFWIFKVVIDHATNYAAAMVCLSLLYLFCGKFTLRERIIFIIMLAAGLASGRAKFYGFFALASCMVLYFNSVDRVKINLKTGIIFAAITGIVLFVAWEKIYLYFVQGITGEVENDLIARFVLYNKSIDILKDYFPFGSGLGSFATHASGLYYSDIYTKYGIENVWGITKQGYYFIADTYYPSLAQFGVVGLILFITFWIYLLCKSFSYFWKAGEIKLFLISAMIIGFLTIENTADASFTSNRGFWMMLFLGVVMSEQRHLISSKQKENIPSDIQ